MISEYLGVKGCIDQRKHACVYVDYIAVDRKQHIYTYSYGCQRAWEGVKRGCGHLRSGC